MRCCLRILVRYAEGMGTEGGEGSVMFFDTHYSRMTGRGYWPWRGRLRRAGQYFIVDICYGWQDIERPWYSKDDFS